MPMYQRIIILNHLNNWEMTCAQCSRALYRTGLVLRNNPLEVHGATYICEHCELVFHVCFLYEPWRECTFNNPVQILLPYAVDIM